MKNISQLFRKDLEDFTPYKTNPTVEQISKQINIPVEKILKLDTGENPYSEAIQPKKFMEKILFYKYPDPICLDVRKAIAAYTKLNQSMVACGNGSDELLDLITRLFVSSGDEIIISPPTFPMYAFYTNLVGGRVIKIVRNADLSINTQRICKAINKKTKIIFVDSPGNPTGNVTPIEKFEKILQKNVIVVSDEVYFEYCGKTAQRLLKKYNNLIIVRSLSKWAGLAGLRIGYMLADPEIIEKILTIKSPYNVNVFAQVITTKVLKQSDKFLKELNKMTNLRDAFIEKLKKFTSLTVFPSQGAYIVLKPKNNKKALLEFLQTKGVFIKSINEPLLGKSFRMNICQEKEMEVIIQALTEFYKE